MSNRKALSITYANTPIDVVGVYYPSKRSNKWAEPDDPPDFEIESVSVGGVVLTDLFECLSVVKRGGWGRLTITGEQDFLEVIRDLCIEKLESQMEI